MIAVKIKVAKLQMKINFLSDFVVFVISQILFV